MTKTVRVIIPALNEEKSIAKVIEEIPSSIVKEIIVCDNGSSDNTSDVAKDAGATVLVENEKGYGASCLKGIEYINKLEDKTDIVVFLDGDYSDYPSEMNIVIKPILIGQAEMVIGSRALGQKEAGSLTPQQVFGNWLATKLLHLFYGVKFTDLGPFRAITLSALNKLNMLDRNYGWTVEMQIKAAKQKIKAVEVPVNYRNRIGFSKVSGTVKGTIMAGYKIIFTLFKYL
ncbi:MAG: glycosyltransferase family 2 protein [Cyclobacteriaceae bacterium]|nr:glycosyltransferase family 2 protein [Cyclobacteriaceae bacterium]